MSVDSAMIYRVSQARKDQVTQASQVATTEDP